MDGVFVSCRQKLPRLETVDMLRLMCVFSANSISTDFVALGARHRRLVTVSNTLQVGNVHIKIK